jgi:hypothetical protein
MRCRLATILGLALGGGLAGPGDAGPWARERGTAFLSTSVTGDTPRTALVDDSPEIFPYTSLYGELGLGHRLTLGAQLGRGATVGEGTVFLRYTLTAPDRPWQVAVDAGLAARSEAGAPDGRLLRLGAAVGRGFAGSDGAGGWLALDLVHLVEIDTGDRAWQAETTLGLSLSDDLRLMLQIKAEDWPRDDPVYTVTPGAAWTLGEATTLHAGARLGLGPDPAVGLTLGLWHDF